MKNINEEVEKTMRSWDKIKRFESNPFLYTRIEQEIKNLENPPRKKISWIWQPIMVSLLVVINFFTITTALSNSETESAYEVIADQYNLSIEDRESLIMNYK